MKAFNICKFTLVVTFLGILCSPNAFAFNRNNVFIELNKLNANWEDISVKMWINDLKDNPDPGVQVGDNIVYNVITSNPAYFAIIEVDAKGGITIYKPDEQASNNVRTPSSTLTFPPPVKDKTDQINAVIQEGPLGKQTLYLLIFDQKIPARLFGIDKGSDVNSDGDIAFIEELVDQLNQITESTKLSIYKYNYLVDGDVAVDTRGTTRKTDGRIKAAEQLKNAVPIVFNDIKFEFNSDVLTLTGVQQLEVIGSDLVERMGRNELPLISLVGHTDSTGNDDYNQLLSERRSVSARRFLVDEFGLPIGNISTDGKGEKEPIGSNSTTQGRAKNRRVEFSVLSLK